MAGTLNWDNMLKKIQDQKASSGTNTKKDYTDHNFYKPVFNAEPDDKGIYPITRKLVRFVTDSENFITTVAKHFFQINGMWYAALCPQYYTKVNGSCPVCQHVYENKLYGTEEGKIFKRKYDQVTNLLIKKDVLTPELEGQVKLFSFGNEIKKILDNAMFPVVDEDLGETPSPFIPWNPLSAPDFKLTITPKKMPNTNKTKKNPSDYIVLPQYLKSEFSKEMNAVDMAALKLIDMSYLTKLEDNITDKCNERFRKVMGVKKASVAVKNDMVKAEDYQEPTSDEPADTSNTHDNDDDFLNSLRQDN
jgi:hypothetical protein